MKTQRTEEDVQADLRKLYAERARIRKEKWKEYEGKSYLVNGAMYFIHRVLDKGFAVLSVEDTGIRLEDMEILPNQLSEYEISNEQFIKALEQKVDVFITTIKERE